MNYKASLDNTAKVITIGVTILFAVIIGGQYRITKELGDMVPIYTSVALLLIYGISYAFSPINYRLTAQELIVHRFLTNATIDRQTIKSVDLIDRSQLNWSVRTFGVGGLFGYYGKFFNSKLGNMTWYATRKDKTVLITTMNNKKIIITPDKAEEFVAEFNQSLGNT